MASHSTGFMHSIITLENNNWFSYTSFTVGNTFRFVNAGMIWIFYFLLLQFLYFFYYRMLAFIIIYICNEESITIGRCVALLIKMLKIKLCSARNINGMCLIQCDGKIDAVADNGECNVKIFIATFSQERRSKAASINPRENARGASLFTSTELRFAVLLTRCAPSPAI